MHDAAEAYCQDIPAPLKALLPDYREIEKRTDQLIRFKFGLPLEEASVVKYADLTMLATERRDLDIDDSIPWVILEGIPRQIYSKSTPSPRSGFRPVYGPL